MACNTIYLNDDFISQSCNNFGNNSETKTLNFRIRNCVGQETNTCEDTFNQTLCDPDEPYFIPVATTYLYFQTHFIDRLNTYPVPSTADWRRNDGQTDFVAQMQITNCCCELLENEVSYAAIEKAQVGRLDNADGSFTYFQNIKINVTGLPDVFGFKFTDMLGNEFWTKDCYHKVPCDNETVLITSQQNKLVDCGGFVYEQDGNFLTGDLFDMFNQTEVYGDSYVNGYTLEKVLVRQSVLSSTVYSKIKLCSTPMSEFQAEHIKNILSTNAITILHSNFEIRDLFYNGEIDKNLTKGKMWRIELELQSLSCVLNYRCLLNN